LPEEQRLLAGLTRIYGIQVCPAERDLLLIGRAEAWVHDQRGNVLGVDTAWPVYRLDDLVSALKAFYCSASDSVSCSIDPTEQGLVRFRDSVSMMQRAAWNGSPLTDLATVMGQHVVTVKGVDKKSRFARVMIAADVRMKRLALQFDQPRVHSLPSYLRLARSKVGIEVPRWWLELRKPSMVRSTDGLTWIIANRPLIARSDHVCWLGDGRVQAEQQGLEQARRWAILLTRSFPDLCSQYVEFAELHNLTDLCLIAFLLRRESLPEEFESHLLDVVTHFEQAKFDNPLSLPTLVNCLPNGRKWLVAASGGVDLRPGDSYDSATVVTAETAPERFPYPDFGDCWWADISHDRRQDGHWQALRGKDHRRSLPPRARRSPSEIVEVPRNADGDWFSTLSGQIATQHRKNRSRAHEEPGDPRVVFVLDRSRSMCRRVGGATLLQHARREIDSWIAVLPVTVKFNVLVFGDGVEAWRPSSVPASPAAKLDAREFITRMPSVKGTAAYDALEWALLSEPAGSHVVFASDGWPTQGKHIIPGDILTAIKSLNAEGRFTIHCLGLACDPVQAAFMKQLALSNNGTFRIWGGPR
jgi:hypothetical protein